MDESVLKPSTRFSLICANIKEATGSLLLDRQSHDKNEWFNLCKRMRLRQIEPISIIRLQRPADSPHRGKPRLLRVTVATEEELEDILLSAFLLRDGLESSERVFADIPWWERAHAKGQSHPKHSASRSVIVSGVPDAPDGEDPQARMRHDILQWKFLRTSLGADQVATVDIYKIPKSSKYMGSAPSRLKVTFLTSAMAEDVFSKWKLYEGQLPKYIRMRTPEHMGISTQSSTVQKVSDSNLVPASPKNDSQPTLSGSAN